MNAPQIVPVPVFAKVWVSAQISGKRDIAICVSGNQGGDDPYSTSGFRNPVLSVIETIKLLQILK